MDGRALRALVTGGAGFIGSHLVDRLLADGCEVLALDNLFTGDKRNIHHHRDNPRFEFVRHDVINPIHIEVDQIYNFATPASPIHYQFDAVQTVKANVMGAINMLDLAKRSGIPVLQASTSEVYGDPEVHPQPEEYWGRVNPIGPRSCYDEGKRCAENLFSDFRRQHGVDAKIVRIFNTYGPRMNVGDGRVISNFIVQALCNEPITIFGDGNQTRSFCYIDDLVEGIVRMMNTPPDFMGPINIGNATEFTVKELASEIIEMTNSRSTLVYNPLPTDDPRQRQPDLSRARQHLGWEPRTPLREGLARTIAYFDGVLAASGRIAADRGRFVPLPVNGSALPGASPPA